MANKTKTEDYIGSINSDGKGSKVESLPNGVDLVSDDIEYFKRKLEKAQKQLDQ